MSGEVAGFPCPQCKSPKPIELVEMIMGILDESRTPVAYDLKCGCCDFEWRVVPWV